VAQLESELDGRERSNLLYNTSVPSVKSRFVNINWNWVIEIEHETMSPCCMPRAFSVTTGCEGPSSLGFLHSFYCCFLLFANVLRVRFKFYRNKYILIKEWSEMQTTEKSYFKLLCNWTGVVPCVATGRRGQHL